MFCLPSENWLRLLIWFAIGLAIYFLYGRRHSVLAGRGTASQRFKQNL